MKKMVKIAVIYDSRTGNTEQMGKAIAEGARSAGADVRLKKAGYGAEFGDMEWADGIIMGSPTHFGSMSDRLKKLINESLSVRGRLEGRIGAAFTSSHHYAGGNETTLMSILQAMLVHGMAVVGDPMKCGGHYGVVAVGAGPDEKVLEECRCLGERVSKLAAKLMMV